MGKDWKDLCVRAFAFINQGFNMNTTEEEYAEWEKQIKVLIAEYDAAVIVEVPNEAKN